MAFARPQAPAMAARDQQEAVATGRLRSEDHVGDVSDAFWRDFGRFSLILGGFSADSHGFSLIFLDFTRVFQYFQVFYEDLLPFGPHFGPFRRPPLDLDVFGRL